MEPSHARPAPLGGRDGLGILRQLERRRGVNVLRRQFGDLGTFIPCFTWCGFPLFDGRMSKSKIALGM